MAVYHFVAIRTGGEKFTGEHEADSKQGVIDFLRKEGATAISIETGHAKGDSSFELSFLNRIPRQEKIVLARNLSAMLVGGLPLSRALEVLRRQVRSKPMQDVLKDIDNGVKQGQSFAAALSNHPTVFTPLFVAMARAGEESGTLAKSLQSAAIEMEKSYQLGKKAKSAMIYPAIVLVVMAAVMALMLIFVVPTLSRTFAGLHAHLPATTRLLIAMSLFVSQNIVYILGAIIAVVLLFALVLRTAGGKALVDRLLLMMPIAGGIIGEVNVARAARTLASMLAAGVPALAALDTTRSVLQNVHFQRVMQSARTNVEKGRPMSEAFVAAERLYPPMFSEMMAAGEETGDLPGMLTHVAEFFEEEVDTQTKDLAAVIEPVLMVIIAIAVGFFAVAMISPIYSLSSNL